jgi:sugar phosphate isomerase/epimerase
MQLPMHSNHRDHDANERAQSGVGLVTRRHFLQHVAVGGLATCGLAKVRADSSKIELMSFGFTLYGMRKLPLYEALNACADIGYDSVELVCMPDWPCDPIALSKAARKELNQRLVDQHLTVASLMENVSPIVADIKAHAINCERLKRACELGHDLASPRLPLMPPLIETVLGGKPAEWDSVRDLMAERLQDWAKIAKEGSAVIALKPHVGGALHTPQGAKLLMEQLKSESQWLKLAYDYSHFELQAIDFKESLKLMLPETAFIHVKDSAGTPDKFQFLLPGDGRTDYREYFRLLQAQRYIGPIVVEVSGQLHTRADYDPVHAAKHSYSKLAPLLTEAGLWKPRAKS